MTLIALDDGHGESTSGKRTPKFNDGSFMKENEFNRVVVKYLDEHLKRNRFETLLVAPTDQDTPLSQRVDLANTKNADLYVSVHANAYGSDWNNIGGGIETYVYKFGGQAEKIARIIHKYLLHNTPLNDRKVKEANFYVLKETKMPAVLVELGFMTKKEEAELLMSDAYRKECAEEIARGICEYYGKEFKNIGSKDLTGLSVNRMVPIKLFGEKLEEDGVLIEVPGGGGITNVPLRNFIETLGEKLKLPLIVTWDNKEGVSIDFKKRIINKERVYNTNIYWVKFKPEEINMKFVYEKGMKVSEIVKKYNADYGFNFPFFYNNLPLGDTEDNDVIISSAYGKMLKWHEFGWQDGEPIIGQLNKNNHQNFLVQGTPLLIENGKLVYEFYAKYDQTNNDIINSKCQRTCVGIDNDGNLIVLVCDGRTNDNKGLSIKELAEFMLSKNCLWALNGDGGGSSTLATQEGVINQNKGINERIVHHAILVFERS